MKRNLFIAINIGILALLIALFFVDNAAAQLKIPQIKTKQSAVMQRAIIEPPDLIVSNFEVCKRFDRDSLATFSITFKNIGQGPSPCFDWLLTDSKGGAWAKSVCPQGSSGWHLQPGAETTVTGTIRKSDIWNYPYKPGYVSHVRVRVNKGSKEPKVNETTEVNNGSQEVDIYWDATGVPNYQCTAFE